MQYGFSIKRKCYLLSVLLMTVWLTGCVQEEFESTPSPAGNGIRFTLTVPDVNLPSVSSRTMTGTGTAKKEDEIETVDILVFDMSKTPAVFLEWVSATGVTQDLADNSTVSFSAVLSPLPHLPASWLWQIRNLIILCRASRRERPPRLRQWKRCSTPKPANGWQTARQPVGIRGFRCTGRR